MNDKAPDYGKAAGRPFNHYVCEKCRQTTITFHEDDGVTPFMLKCRATPNCQGVAYSSFYRNSQDPAQVPHVIWYRPATPETLDKAIRQYPKRFRADVLQHFNLGGCLDRKPASIKPAGI